jgi:hypothetical protein
MRGHDTYIPSFAKIGSDIRVILEVLSQTLERCSVGTTD